MSIVIPGQGELAILQGLLNASLVIHLYVNNKTPGETDVASSYAEATGGGYAAQSLTYANWTYSGINPTMAAYPTLTWTFTGALSGNATIYGYYVTRATDGVLLWAESMSPFTPASNGDYRAISLQIGIG